jgi:methyltransferase-like protein/2-polyprenyl-3-methyl-5-hydroxy-6-metoxy-1,4-benzoquinol methylase
MKHQGVTAMSDTQADELGRYYDSVPYESHPFPQSAVEHLESLAFLFGLETPPLARARVLELGCAAGSNLIPFAARYPGAKVVGLDLSPVQIEEGLAAVERAGLDNVDLRVFNIAQIDASLGEFDYIVCHGVYSWVPEPVQDAILRTCSRNLAPTGVAYVSYNVYPGWKAREIVRDAMILRGGPRDSAAEKLSYARGMLEFLEQSARSGSVLQKTLEEAMPLIRGANDSYLLHEFLEPCNSPCYFKEFVRRANVHGLDYLSESDASTMFVQNYGDKVRQPLLNECGDSQVMMEQYLDFIVNRMFRQTLLVKQDRAGAIRYRLDQQRLRGFGFAATFTPVDGGPIVVEPGEQPCRTHRNASVTLRLSLHKAVAQILHERFPATVGVEALIDEATTRTGQAREEVDAMVMKMLEEMLIVGAIGFRRSQPRLASGVSERPQALATARTTKGIDLAAGQTATACNQWHEPVGLSAIERCLLPLLDGSRARAELAAHLSSAVRSGRLIASIQGQPVEDDALDAFMKQQLEEALAGLRRRALLVA